MTINLPTMFSLHVFIIISMIIFVGKSSGHFCPDCDKTNCLLPTSCVGGVVIDACDCCEECAKQVNETCGGGSSSIHGKCDSPLACIISPAIGEALTGNEVGVCKDVNNLPPAINHFNRFNNIDDNHNKIEQLKLSDARKNNNNNDDDEDNDIHNHDNDYDVCTHVVCDIEEYVEQPRCPIDSKSVHLEESSKVMKKCCIDSNNASTCECLPCSETSIPKPICTSPLFQQLVVVGNRKPGTCCNKYKCVDKETYCEDIQCNDNSTSDRESETCPTDSNPIPFEPYDVCCFKSKGCLCKPKDQCLVPKLDCPVGKVMKKVMEGTPIPGSCCDVYECVNETLKTCTYNNKIYNDGDEVMAGPCTKCKCNHWILSCSKLSCPSVEGCEWTGMPTNESCCDVCRGCFDPLNKKKHFYDNGETWAQDDCTLCKCEGGVSHCVAERCQTRCSSPRHVPGQCCPECDVDESIISINQDVQDSLDPPCNLKCPFGYVKDSKSKQSVCICANDPKLYIRNITKTTPSSKPIPTTLSEYPLIPNCPKLFDCSLNCLYGQQMDTNGCFLCSCNSCPQLVCNKKCVPGYQTNDDGCQICKCADTGLFNPYFSPHSPSHRLPTANATLTRGRPCVSANNREVSDGHSWWDGCRKCFCNHGYEMCELVVCPPVRCSNPLVLPESCCPTCPGSDSPAMLENSGMCFSSDGRYFVEGETWVLDRCTQCICHKGTPLCSIESCPPLLCHHPIVLVDSCCPVCLNSLDRQNNASYKNNYSKVQLINQSRNKSCYTSMGMKANHGDAWKVSPCQSCVCRDGQINCYSQTCPILGCSKTVLKKGHCCPSCVERSILYCVYNNVTYDNSESWLIDDCTTCACMDGQILCTVSICEPISCHKPVLVPGKCCPVCQIKEPSPYYNTKNDSIHPLNITLIVVLISIIAILAIAIIVLLGMLLWLRPRLNRHLRRASSITLHPSSSLNPLNMFNQKRDHQQLNDEKSVSSSLLPLNSVQGMVSNNANGSSNGPHQQQQTVGNLLLKYNNDSAPKLRLSINESHPYDVPSLSAAVSSMTTASLSSSSSAVKKRLSSSDGYSDERHNANNNGKLDNSLFNGNNIDAHIDPNDFSNTLNIKNNNAVINNSNNGDSVIPMMLPPLPPRIKPMLSNESTDPSLHNLSSIDNLDMNSDDKLDKDDITNLNDDYDEHVLGMMESYTNLNGEDLLDVVVADGGNDNSRVNSIFRSPLKSSRFSDLDNDLTRHLLNPSPSQDNHTNNENLNSTNYLNNKNRNSNRDNKMLISNRKSW